MDYSKEGLLIIATTLIAAGVNIIKTNVWQGVAVLLIGAFVIVGRGFYKKYFAEKK